MSADGARERVRALAGSREAQDEADWQPTRRSDLYDVVLMAVLAVVGGGSLYLGGDPALSGEMSDYWRPAGVVLTALCIAPLVVRRRHPLAVLAVTTTAVIALRVLEVPEGTASAVTLFLALYTAGAYGRRHRDLVRAASVAAIVALLVWMLATRADGYEGSVSQAFVNGFTALQNVLYLVAAWLLGDLVRTRRLREATLVRQAEELRAAHADEAARAVLDERLRIARELHDVVAHHVSVMGVQAGAARHVLGKRPEQAAELLASVEESSRQAVRELSQLLGLLRRADESSRADGQRGGDGIVDPQPTLARLDGLAAQMREAGLDVAVAVDLAGLPVDDLPPAVALAAYRIVQEALTNTLKHAGRGARSQVVVTRHAAAVEVIVGDDGRRPHAGAGSGGPGLGQVGMRERVALVDGELRVGRRADGGYEVRAWLPVAALPAGAAGHEPRRS